MTATGPHSGPNETPSPQHWRVCDAAPPADCVLDRHGGHDLLGGFVRHRPEHAFSGDRYGTDCVGGDARTGDGKNLSCRLGVEPAYQCGESGGVEVMNSGSRGSQLHGMTSLGGQVQIGPGDDVLAGVGGQSPQAKSLQHRAETDLDADQFEAAVRAARKHHIGDPRHSPSHDVDDLGVKDIAYQQYLVVCERIDRRRGRKRRRVVVSANEDTGVLEALYRRPRHQQIRLATAPHKDPLHQVRAGLIVEASCEVGNSADQLAVRSPDVLASHLAKREHIRIMPLRQRRAPSPPVGRASRGEGAADVLGALTEVGHSAAVRHFPDTVERRRAVRIFLSVRHPGYHLTGDGGYLDEDGYPFVMGRIDYVINVGGHRLSTGQMKAVLASHPAVAECAVIVS